jgi:hypothetical protein
MLNMMQLDGRYFLSIFLKSEDTVVTTICDPDQYASKPAKKKLKVGIITIDVSKNYKLESFQSMFASLLIR